MEFKHIPVLKDEVISGLNIRPDGLYIDCTIGGGGHSEEILKRLKAGSLIGFDRDDEAILASTNRLKKYKNIKIIKANFHDAADILKEQGISQIDGILIDLGVSSHQIDDSKRGFSFNHDGPLDMRMDRSQKLSAWDVVNTFDKEELLKILYTYGEESNAKNIVNKILEARKITSIDTTLRLKEVIESAFPKKIIYTKGGVTKKSFQAIRIFVNGELDGLYETILNLAALLKDGGRLAIISFHSLEDRIVKNAFKELSTGCICPPKTPICICGHKASGVIITKKPITAKEQELIQNDRSAPAKLRVFEKRNI